MKKEHEDKQQPTASDLPIVMLTPCSTNQTGRPQKQTMAAIKILPFNSQQAAFCLDLQRLQFEAGCGRWKIWTPRSDGTALKQFWKFSEKKNESSFYTVYCTVYLLIFLGILSHLYDFQDFRYWTWQWERKSLRSFSGFAETIGQMEAKRANVFQRDM